MPNSSVIFGKATTPNGEDASAPAPIEHADAILMPTWTPLQEGSELIVASIPATGWRLSKPISVRVNADVNVAVITWAAANVQARGATLGEALQRFRVSIVNEAREGKNKTILDFVVPSGKR